MKRGGGQGGLTKNNKKIFIWIFIVCTCTVSSFRIWLAINRNSYIQKTISPDGLESVTDFRNWSGSSPGWAWPILRLCRAVSKFRLELLVEGCLLKLKQSRHHVPLYADPIKGLPLLVNPRYQAEFRADMKREEPEFESTRSTNSHLGPRARP